MKRFLLVFMLFSFSLSYAQTQTEKYNSILNRYEVFDSNGNMIAYKVYNNILRQWEYNEVNSSNSSSSYYDNIPIYEPNLDLIHKVLAKKEAQYNAQLNRKRQISISNYNVQPNPNYNVKNQPLTNNELAIQYYQFGLNDQENGNTEQAIENYKKAIELNPNFSDAYINVIFLTMQREKVLLNEMKSLQQNEAGNIRFKYLRNTLNEVYESVVPYLQKVLEIDPSHSNSRRLLNDIQIHLKMKNLSPIKIHKSHPLEGYHF
jgi:tetratricopeptide (TPR) repeat protein